MPLTIFRRGKVWHYRGSVAGRRLRGSTGATDKATAQRVAAEIEARQWKGSLDGPGSVLTFSQAALLYLKAGKPTRFVANIAAHWKDTPVREINAGAIRQAAIALYPKASGATRNRQCIVPTQAIINHAAGLDFTTKVSVERYPVIKREKEPATWEWVQAFMANARPHLGALACFMYLTGTRITDALSLRWEDVQLAKGRALIRQGKLSGEEHWAHLPPVLVAAIANIDRTNSETVFRYSSRDTAAPQWDKAIRRAGIEQLSFHACRHGFATGLLNRGVNPKTVAKRGGWKDVRHVYETYAHDVASETITELLIDTPQTQATRRWSQVVGE